MRRAAAAALVMACGLSIGRANAMGVSVPADVSPVVSSSRSEAAKSLMPLPEDSGNAAAARVAIEYLGVPYVWGGASPSGFDCSGLPVYAYAKVGKSLPHYTVAIWNMLPKVASNHLQPGDLVFFHDLGHMGIYIGAGLFVHSPHTGDVVKISEFSTYPGYVGAVRP
jgi:peptidoglycan DL-endopeptidase CwlO